VARKFREASELLHDLLDRHEAGIVNVRAYPDHDGFRDIGEADRFDRELSRAVATGSVGPVNGTGRQRDRIVRVDLIDPQMLYRYLGRSPAPHKANAAAELVFDCLELNADIEATAYGAIAAWSRNRRWSGLVPGDAQGLRKAVLLAQAILDRKHRGLDYRTFSRRIAGGSKELESLEPAVLRILAGASLLPDAADGRSALSELGLDRFGPPLLLAGNLLVDGFPVPISLPYIGLPAREVTRVRFTTAPRYILSIENQTSFNRQVMEVDPERTGLVLYTGGFPSLDIQRAIAHLATSFPEVPIFHWSDIDPEGAMIFRTVERAAGRPVIPHLMEAALADLKGESLGQASGLRTADFTGSAMLGLARYFESPEANWLEQEELDPQLPLVPQADGVSLF
jgi:hypothetical protein